MGTVFCKTTATFTSGGGGGAVSSFFSQPKNKKAETNAKEIVLKASFIFTSDWFAESSGNKKQGLCHTFWNRAFQYCSGKNDGLVEATFISIPKRILHNIGEPYVITEVYDLF
jgi:hypothetical protein